MSPGLPQRLTREPIIPERSTIDWKPLWYIIAGFAAGIYFSVVSGMIAAIWGFN